MAVSDRILEFYKNLHLDDQRLPLDVKAMNPYADPPMEVEKVIRQFYEKFYSDQRPRGLILGINPGRFGAGVTGIPFTDSYRLQQFCGIPFPEDTRETSSVFVYDVIEKYGGAVAFYQDWFIGAVSPLGFIRKNARGNWVNWNYYDQPELEKEVRSFIIEKLKEQKEICGNPESCVILGMGKNYKYLKKLNAEIGLFSDIIPLEHPRYIMQYKLKRKEEFVDKFLESLKTNKIM